MNTPRRKRYNRKTRLPIAAQWIKSVSCNHIKRYAKWYGVSRLCATLELITLGVKLPEGSLEKEKAIEQMKAHQNQLRKELRAQKEAEEFRSSYGWSDHFNAYDEEDILEYVDQLYWEPNPFLEEDMNDCSNDF